MKLASRGRYWDVETRYGTGQWKGFMGWRLYSRTGRDRQYTYLPHQWRLLVAYHTLSRAQQAYVETVAKQEGEQ
jgi:hypothetical protein